LVFKWAWVLKHFIGNAITIFLKLNWVLYQKVASFFCLKGIPEFDNAESAQMLPFSFLK